VGGGPPNKRKPAPTHATPSPDDAALGVVVTAARVGAAAARILTWAPGVRPFLERSAETGRAARARGRERLESAAQTALSGPEVGRLVDGALAGPLPEAVARSSVTHHVGDRLAAQLEPERERVLQQLLESPEFERALETALSSPKVREALAHQTTSFAAEIADEVHERTAALDGKVSLGPARAALRFGGAVSRGLAFVIDLLLAYLVFLVGATIVGLVASLAGDLRPGWLFGSIAGAGWLLVLGTYFVFFWSLGGQSPGMRLAHLRVVDRSGAPPSLVRAAVRFPLLIVAMIPGFAGLLPVLFTEERRGLHDYLAGTVVVYTN
jgi:uncharacterized RDD family membrane protein YckC